MAELPEVRIAVLSATTPGEIADLPDAPLGEGPIATSLRERGLASYHDACRFIQALPYARAQSWSTVIAEGRGTCNSKHALLVMLARELGLRSVQLGLGMFELSGEGFPAVARVLAEAGIPCMLEAHCYLVVGRKRVDLTWPSDQAVPHPRFLHEQVIEPSELPEGKVRRHRSYLETWLVKQGWGMSVDRAWVIREACIAALSQPS
ncbi:hypothetical protein ACNOYE_40255 [Nannocystaceae bacterium ST9]